MKIVQDIICGSSLWSSGSHDPINHGGYFNFKKSDYSGITHAYFRAKLLSENGSYTGHCELYDYTASAVIVTLTQLNTSWEWKESADIKASLPENHELGIRLWQEGAEEDDFIDLKGPELVIMQDDETATKKTLTSIPLTDDYYYTPGSSFGAAYTGQFRPPLESINGTVAITFEVNMSTEAGGQAEARIFDITTGTPVADSTISTTSGGIARVESGEITLQSDHLYILQVRNTNGAKYSEIGYGRLKIKVSNFYKVAAACASIAYFTGGMGGGYEIEDVEKKLFNSAISATLSKQYDIIRSILATDTDAGPWHQKLYNITKASDVAGSVKATAIVNGVYYNYEDILTLTNDDDYYAFEGDSASWEQIGCASILALLQDVLPPLPYIVPDASQPSGYHCFMKQFIKNCLAGFAPEITPDCLNFCW